jgi:sugar lactone lactonase YvrE
MIRFTVTRQATFAAAFTVALGCGYDSTAPTYPVPPEPPVREGLWTSSGINPGILRLSPTQLITTGDRVPATAIVTSSAELFSMNAIAFASDGTLWITSEDDSTLIALAPTSLVRSGSTNAPIVISSIGGSVSAPSGLAFDRQHRLWVANAGNGTVVRFDPEQLASSGSPVPAVVISGLGKPVALAFDAAGSLWVSDIHRSKVFSFSEAQLSTSGLLAPQVILTTIAATPPATGRSLLDPAGIAFDAGGNLWVANLGNQTIVSFSPPQLATSGSPVPHVVLSSSGGSLSFPTGVAFDADGSLWAITDAGVLEKFPSTSLGVTGAPSPSVRVALTGYTQFWSVAFWPRPAGLPLN